MELKYRCGTNLLSVSLESKEGGWLVDWGEGERLVNISPGKPGIIALSLGDERVRAYIAHSEGRTYVFIGGHTFVFEEPRGDVGGELGGGAAEVSDGKLCVEAPMPGKVVKVCIGEGDEVGAGEVLVILEAMKMELELASPQAGKVSSILVKDEELVDAAQVLVEVEVGDS